MVIISIIVCSLIIYFASAAINGCYFPNEAAPKESHVMLAATAVTIVLFGVHALVTLPWFVAVPVSLLAVFLISKKFIVKVPRPVKKAPTTHGSAEWGSSNDLERCGHFGKKSFLVAKTKDEKFVKHDGHLTVMAPTGSGKGIGFIIPNLLTYEGSALVLDVKGENYAVSKRQREKMGQKVYAIDPFSVVTSESSCFNVLDTISLDSPDCIGDALIISSNMVLTTLDKADHWDESAQNLIQGLILYAKTMEKSKQNLVTVRHLLTCNSEELESHLEKMTMSGQAFGIIQRAANVFASKNEKERLSILSTAQRHTAFIDDPRIAACFSGSSFDISSIQKKKTSIYAILPPSKLQVNSRFVRLIIGSVLSTIMKQKSPKYEISLFLDEFAQLGYMEQIENGISILRGYKASIVIILQDLSQLKGIYKKWQTFLANSGKIFFAVSDIDTAKYISETLGKKTGTTQSTSHSDHGMTTSYSNQARSLLNPDEVLTLAREQVIYLVPSEKPYKLSRISYLNDSQFIGLYDENPYHRA